MTNRFNQDDPATLVLSKSHWNDNNLSIINGLDHIIGTIHILKVITSIIKNKNSIDLENRLIMGRLLRHDLIL